MPADVETVAELDKVRVRESRARIAVSSAAIVLYVASLGLPALEFKADPAVAGWGTLVAGWVGVVMLQPAWLANPVFFHALILFWRREYYRARNRCVVAILLALTSYFCREWYFNEAYGTPVVGLGAGFYVWVLSFITLALGIRFWINPAVLAIEAKREETAPPSEPVPQSRDGSS